MTSILSNIISSTGRLVQKCWTPLVGLPTETLSRSPATWTAVRFRFHADKVARGPALRRYGYEDKIFQKGLLPRPTWTDKALPMPEYKPKNSWNEKRALFGQNDYIDILGPTNELTSKPVVHPVQLLYHVPTWLRGFKGNEYQVLLKKKRHLVSIGAHKWAPTKWTQLNLRMRQQFKMLNKYTRSPMWKDA